MGILHLVLMQSGCQRWQKREAVASEISKSPKVENNLQEILSNEKIKQLGEINR
jgi:hypothetical protein